MLSNSYVFTILFLLLIDFVIDYFINPAAKIQIFLKLFAYRITKMYKFAQGMNKYS